MKRLWIVVHTTYGMLETPEIFYRLKFARQRCKELRKSKVIKDYDELKIFEKRIGIINQ